MQGWREKKVIGTPFFPLIKKYNLIKGTYFENIVHVIDVFFIILKVECVKTVVSC
jgi:hypothetical protein